MGHNLGLYHSHSLDCGYVVVGSSGCSAAEYGDALDVMGGTPTVGTAGNVPTAHFNAFQKERLGWLNSGISPPLTTIQNSNGQFSIGNLEAARSNTPRALKIANQVATCNLPATEWYYVEKREAVGFDELQRSLQRGNPGALADIRSHRPDDGRFENRALGPSGADDRRRATPKRGRAQLQALPRKLGRYPL